MDINTDELLQDYSIARLALETLTYAISEGENIEAAYQNARAALQWTKTLIEYGEVCDCDDNQ